MARRAGWIRSLCRALLGACGVCLTLVAPGCSSDSAEPQATKTCGPCIHARFTCTRGAWVESVSFAVQGRSESGCDLVGEGPGTSGTWELSCEPLQVCSGSTCLAATYDGATLQFTAGSYPYVCSPLAE